MKFWDTSAVVPLCIIEPRSSLARDILLKDTAVVVWWATRIECVSAFERVRREGGLDEGGTRAARDNLSVLENSWTEISPNQSLRESAERLLSVHSLKAADSLQLASALQWCAGVTKDAFVVSFDVKLREAAQREGFHVEPSSRP